MKATHLDHCVLCNLLCVLALLAGTALSVPAADVPKSVKSDPQVKEKASKDIFGLYNLASVDGKAVPTTVSHAGTKLQISSGSFTIAADGSCTSKMTITPPGAPQPATVETKATFTRDGSTLRMQWTRAGITTGKISSNGDTFTMQNEGMTFTYRRTTETPQH